MTSTRSHWTRFERWAGPAGWVGLGIEVVLWYLLASVPMRQPLLALAIGAVLILGTWASVLVLCIRYRRFLTTYYALAGLVAALALVTWGRGVVASRFAGLPIMGILGLLVALPMGIVFVLRRRDVSAELIGLVLLAFLWVPLLASVPYGGPIRVWLNIVTGDGTAQFWWFETLTCLLMMVLPIGSLAFIAHMIRLGIREAKGS